MLFSWDSRKIVCCQKFPSHAAGVTVVLRCPRNVVRLTSDIFDFSINRSVPDQRSCFFGFIVRDIIDRGGDFVYPYISMDSISF